MRAVTLRVLTFNTWAFNPPLGTHVPARMRAFGEALPGLEVDVAALQEVWDAAARDELVAAGRRAGLLHAWGDERPRAGGGLLVLSRTPLRAARFEAFELGGFPEALHHADYWGGKGFVEIRLATQAGELRLFNTHLHAAYGARENDAYIGHRTGQILQLAERIVALDAPCIVAGDLNFEDGFAEHAILTGLTGLRDTALAVGSAAATVRRQNPYRPGVGEADARIDYVFCRDGRHTRVQPESSEVVLAEPFEIDGDPAAPSDHAGLVTEFVLRAGASDRPAPAPTAIELARAALDAGRKGALTRRKRQRTAGGVGLATGALAWLGRRKARQERRHFLRKGLGTLAIASGLVGIGSFPRAGLLRAEEIAGFDAALARLERLERREARG